MADLLEELRRLDASLDQLPPIDPEAFESGREIEQAQSLIRLRGALPELIASIEAHREVAKLLAERCDLTEFDEEMLTGADLADMTLAAKLGSGK